MSEEYEIDNSSDPLTDELEDGEVLQQNAELVCVDQEEMDRLAAEGIVFFNSRKNFLICELVLQRKNMKQSSHLKNVFRG